MTTYITGYRDPFWSDPRVSDTFGRPIQRLKPRPPFVRTWQASSLRGEGFGSYAEKRVRVGDYGRVQRTSDLLTKIPTVKGFVGKKGWVPCCRPTAKLHTGAVDDFRNMAAAIKKDLGIDLKVTTGWRPHRWRDRAQYEAYLKKRFGSVKKGKKYLAFNSPHETGLAFDIGVGGLWPTSKTIAKQRKTKLHKWLVKNAWRFGWRPYKAEPWHWEHPVTYNVWANGPGAGPGGALVGVGLASLAAWLLLLRKG